jgi:hypothetical protein
MADFLTRLARRAIGTEPTVRPVLAPLFAPGPDLPAVGADDSLIAIEEQDHDAPAHVPSSRRPVRGAAPPSGPIGEPASTLPVPHPPLSALAMPTAAPSEPSASGSPQSASRAAVPPPSPLSGDQPAAAPPAGQPTVEVPPLAAAPPERAEVIASRAAAASVDRPAVAESLPRPVEPTGLLTSVSIANKGRSEESAARPVESAMAATPPPAEAAPPPPPTVPPTIRVSIGRIDVRAVQAPVSAPRRTVPTAPAAPSLEEYLRARGGGRR